jgi:hypothetical protein
MFAKKTEKSDFELAFLGRTGYTNVVEAHGVGMSPLPLTGFSGGVGCVRSSLWFGQ